MTQQTCPSRQVLTRPSASDTRISSPELPLPRDVVVSSSEAALTSLLKKMATIEFWKGRKESLHGTLERGKEVRIEYDANRLPCRDYRNGKRAWDIFAVVRFADHGNEHTIRLEGPDKENKMTTMLKMPGDAKSLIMFFKHWGYFSGSCFDNNSGQNYEFPLDQVVFTGDWQEYVKGSLRPGGKFQVVYDSKRLPWRDGGYSGLGYAWNIFAEANFSYEGPVVQHMLQEGSQEGNTIMTTIYDIPEDADEVAMWFFFTGYVSGKHYDSNNSQNYHFALTKN